VRIAVNTRLLLKDKLEGLGRFTHETLKLMVAQHPEHEFYFLFDRPFDESFIYASNVIPVVVNPPARHPVLWHVWFEMSLPKALKRIQPDLFLSPDGFLSLNADVKSLPVIHDLNFVYNPQDLAKSHSWFYNRYFPKYAKKAARIATVSEYSRQDIAKQYGIEESKIDVVYNGVSERFSPVGDAEIERVQETWSNGRPYFIYVGSIHQRKNIERMLQSFDEFKKTDQSHKFILVGNRKWWTESMQQALDSMKFKHDVIFAGRVSDEDLNDLMGAACANVYVSTFEGFGIPIIEAFQSGVPVITSNTTSMPEIAGEAALVVDPFSVSSITEAMISIAHDEVLRTELIRKGQERAKQFTWQRTADLLWDSVTKTLQ
jgi:glycosyltransferase involved in cell wall biosynthesis